MAIKYASTGKEVVESEGNSESHERDQYKLLRNRNADVREQIAERIFERREKSASEAHDKALEHFQYTYPDIVANPNLLRRFINERQTAINEASEKREIISDWDSTYRSIGDRISEQAGFPTSTQIERKEALDEMKKARGLDSAPDNPRSQVK